MKKIFATLALASSLAALTAAVPANAATPRHFNTDRSYEAPVDSQGYYDGNYEFHVDQSDHASSPYSGGGGM